METQTVAADEWHFACTALEYTGIGLLLVHQGLVRPRSCKSGLKQLWRRIAFRISCPRRKHAGALAAISLGGSVVLGAVGLLTGFCSVHLPGDWKGAAVQLLVTFFMPGLIEEIIFRALLLRLPLSDVPEGLDDCLIPHERELVHGTSERALDDEESIVENHMDENNVILASKDVDCNEREEGTQFDIEKTTCAVNSEVADLVPLSPSLGCARPDEENVTPTIKLEDFLMDADNMASADHAAKVSGTHSSRPPWYELLAALVIFVVYHLDLMHQLRFFRDWRFLLLALILGFCCQEACIRTRSIWPGVIMHWLWVWIWLVFGFGV